MKKNILFAGLFSLCALMGMAQSTQVINSMSSDYADQLEAASVIAQPLIGNPEFL